MDDNEDTTVEILTSCLEILGVPSTEAEEMVQKTLKEFNVPEDSNWSSFQASANEEEILKNLFK